MAARARAASVPSPEEIGGMEAMLRKQAIWSEHVMVYSDAEFFYERLVAEFPTEENKAMLGRIYLVTDQPHRAYHLLRGLVDDTCRYFFASACLELGRVNEANTCLTAPAGIPMGAAGLHLMGRLHTLMNRDEGAAKCHSAALRACPGMWSAFEELCRLGHASKAQWWLDTNNAEEMAQAEGAGDEGAEPAGYSPTPVGQTPQTAPNGDGPTPGAPEAPQRASRRSALATGSPAALAARRPVAPSRLGQPAPPFDCESGEGDSPGTACGVPAATGPNPPHRAETTTMPAGTPRGDFATPTASSHDPPELPRRRRGRQAPATGPGSHAPASAAPSTGLLSARRGKPRRTFLDEGKVRKVSSKLFGETPEGTRDRPTSIDQRAGATGSSSTPVCRASPEDPVNVKEAVGLGLAKVPGAAESAPLKAKSFLGLLGQIGKGVALLSTYQCEEALKAFRSLPTRHYATGWVLARVGRALHELADHAEAEQAFALARRIEPSRLKDLDIYSTVLWHLRRELELARLAQEVVEIDRRCPTVWIVVGNCFSLQKDREAALRFFQRALQLDPGLAYAYTLSGHEHLAGGDAFKAMCCYRNASRIDRRHYNSWFGTGLVNYRQKEYRSAESSFRRALTINPRSSVLHCWLGMTLVMRSYQADALTELERAVEADPRNSLARMTKANVLTSMSRHGEALAELEALQEIAPHEPAVAYAMGLELKSLGRRDEAMASFCAALDLNPPSLEVSRIRAEIDSIGIPSDGSGEEPQPR